MIVLCLEVNVLCPLLLTYAWFVLHQKHQTGLSNAFVQCWQIHSSIPIGCMLFGSERENLLFWISRPLLSVVGMPCVNSPLSVRVQRPSRLLMNHLMQFSTFLSPHLIDGKLQPNVLHGYSLLQCTSEYILRALLLFLWRRGRLMSLEVILNTLRSVVGAGIWCWLCIQRYSLQTISIHKPDPATILCESIQNDF